MASEETLLALQEKDEVQMKRSGAAMSTKIERLQILEKLLFKAWALLVKKGLIEEFMMELTRGEHLKMMQEVKEWQSDGTRNQSKMEHSTLVQPSREACPDRQTSQTEKCTETPVNTKMVSPSPSCTISTPRSSVLSMMTNVPGSGFVSADVPLKEGGERIPSNPSKANKNASLPASITRCNSEVCSSTADNHPTGVQQHVPLSGNSVVHQTGNDIHIAPKSAARLLVGGTYQLETSSVSTNCTSNGLPSKDGAVCASPPEAGTISGNQSDAPNILISDDLGNFNVIQEETVGVPVEMGREEGEETFIPPFSRKVQKTGVTSLTPSLISNAHSTPLTNSRPTHIGGSICGECGKSFATKRNLRHHVKVIHESGTTHTCGVCARVFRHSHNLTIHKRNQNHFDDEEEYLMKLPKCHQCSLCPKTFQSKGNLEAHLRLHTGVRPFGCSHCSRRFAQRSNCKKHELTHTNQRPFTCDHCHWTFTSSSNLQRHEMSTHRKGKCYLCTTCGKSYTQRWNLKKHEQKHV